MADRGMGSTPAGKSRPKATGRSRAGGPRTSATQPKSARIEGKVVAGRRSREQATGAAASRLIDRRIRDLGGWRGETLARMRALILKADPEMMEEWKWRGTPVWSHHGIVCTGETYTKVVKLTFARGARVPDPSRLFNSSLEGNTRRAIDLHEGARVDAGEFQALVRAAVALNGPPAKAGANAKPDARKAKPSHVRDGGPVVLLSGGNPQIAKADGDAPVQAYISAMPAWKRELGRRLDALIVRNAPTVHKAVKWNSPLYGIEARVGSCRSTSSPAT